jgi:hypothetical protein
MPPNPRRTDTEQKPNKNRTRTEQKPNGIFSLAAKIAAGG